LQTTRADGSRERIAMLGSIDWAVAALWLHVLAAMVWTGALAFFGVAFAPAARSLAPEEAIAAFERGRRALQTLSWIAIQILLLTGALNVYFRLHAGDPGAFYLWTLAVKVLLFGAMVFHQSLQAFKYGPRIAAAAECGETQAASPTLRENLTRWTALLNINTAIGLVVLLLGIFLGR
jgi:uncharacterized membrane protein